MPGKISELATLTGAVANGADLLETVDVSDTSMAASGTNKKLTLTNLIAFLNVNGVGASNEVFVGPNDPIATYPEAELWLDTDAVVALANDERWNTAWGIVARYVHSTDITGIGATETTVNSGSYANFVLGRRYSLVIRVAHSQTVATDTFFIRAWIGGTQVLHVVPEATTSVRVYQVPSVSYIPSAGGSLAVSLTVQRSSGTGTATAGNANYLNSVIEVIDEGPVTLEGATPQPTTGPEAIKPATPSAGFRFFAIDTKREWLYDGTGWVVMSEPTQSYTMTLTQVTLGAGGTNTGTYHRSDGWCDVLINLSLGTGGNLTGQPLLGLPFPAHYIQRYAFAVHFYWLGTNVLRGLNAEVQTAGTAIQPLATWGDTGNGREAGQNLSATHPFTWATGCQIIMCGRYRMNSRYS